MKIIGTLFLIAVLAPVCMAAERLQAPLPAIDPATGLPVGNQQPAMARRGGPAPIDPATGLPMKEAEPEKRFDLDFKGGPVKQFIAEVERAARMPVNAIIPEEHDGFYVPSLKLRNVTLPQLFDALTKASARTELYKIGPPNSPNSYNYQQYTKSYGFRTSDSRPSANSIWYFFVDSPPPAPASTSTPQKSICRFWQLEPYLQRMQVDDITTAIETGWKMLAVSPAPKMSFHKDTRLLIVVGQPEQLTLVDDVLRELGLPPEIDPATGLPVNKGPRNSTKPPVTGEKPTKR